jgi:hypothetical protein
VEYDRDRRRCCLSRLSGRCRGGEDNVDSEAGEIAGERIQTLVLLTAEAVLHHEILPLDPAVPTERLRECFAYGPQALARCEISDARGLPRRLGLNGERRGENAPGDCR